MIRDRTMCGISDDAMLKCLLAELTLSYRRVVELAQSLERAGKNVKELKFEGKNGESTSAPTPLEGVHRVAK